VSGGADGHKEGLGLVTRQNFYRGGRNSRSGHSPLLGQNDPRNRSRPASGRTGDDLGDSMTLDDDGRMTVDIDEASGLVRTPDGKLAIDPKKLSSSIVSQVFETTTVTGGSTEGAGGGGDTINNYYTLDDTLSWLGW